MIKQIFSYLGSIKVKRFLAILILLSLAYGGGRLYYRLTDGFLESNIHYAMPADPRWETASLSPQEKDSLNQILSQPFHYLGKGCQSYVFASEDSRHVIKFFKYQRFRPQAWLDQIVFLPFVDEYRLGKIDKKKRKLDNVFSSWKLAYEELQPETGVVYVHLNKVAELDSTLVVFDKLGFRHEIDLGVTEFMLQKKVDMLCPTLLKLRDAGNFAAAQELIDNLFAMLLSEYERGYADNDHALMQNTGVDGLQPLHIDVGQFVKNPIVADIGVRNQELFNKTWKFRIWLRKNDPLLADYTDDKLQEIIGEGFVGMKTTFDKSSMGRIPNH